MEYSDILTHKHSWQALKIMIEHNKACLVRHMAHLSKARASKYKSKLDAYNTVLFFIKEHEKLLNGRHEPLCVCVPYSHGEALATYIKYKDCMPDGLALWSQLGSGKDATRCKACQGTCDKLVKAWQRLLPP